MAGGGRVDQTSVPGVLRDHRERIRNLEAVPQPATPAFLGRIVWGSVLNDGGELFPGSGDWTSSWVFLDHVIAITLSTPFLTRPAITATPNDGGAPFTAAPPFGFFGDFWSGFLLTSMDAGMTTIYVAAYDLDGNYAIDNQFGFDFTAVGT